MGGAPRLSTPEADQPARRGGGVATTSGAVDGELETKFASPRPGGVRKLRPLSPAASRAPGVASPPPEAADSEPAPEALSLPPAWSIATTRCKAASPSEPDGLTLESAAQTVLALPAASSTPDAAAVSASAAAASTISNSIVLSNNGYIARKSTVLSATSCSPLACFTGDCSSSASGTGDCSMAARRARRPRINAPLDGESSTKLPAGEGHMLRGVGVAKDAGAAVGVEAPLMPPKERGRRRRSGAPGQCC
mmetsp:Transcript_57897/g.167814  ORF Transcript_57897/g.167814 Transcript_57897/m.167814 type:complete len:251 (-) Transcript_57897:1194-1946(-)